MSAPERPSPSADAPLTHRAPTHRALTHRALTHQALALARADDGMSTAEYAIGTVAAAGFAALLYTVISGNSVVGALTGIIQRALSTAF